MYNRWGNFGDGSGGVSFNPDEETWVWHKVRQAVWELGGALQRVTGNPENTASNGSNNRKSAVLTASFAVQCAAKGRNDQNRRPGGGGGVC